METKGDDGKTQQRTEDLCEVPSFGVEIAKRQTCGLLVGRCQTGRSPQGSRNPVHLSHFWIGVREVSILSPVLLLLAFCSGPLQYRFDALWSVTTIA